MGYNFHGTNGINKLVSGELNQVNEQEIISIVARLKYPGPVNDLEKWKKKHNSRIQYIKRRHTWQFSFSNRTSL